MSKYALVLVPLYSNLTDHLGNQYLNQGFIKSQNYKSDKTLYNGLFGIIWGKTDTVCHFTDTTHWLIVKIEDVNRLIYIDADLVKFESGLIVFSTKQHSEAANYIAKYLADNKDIPINPWEISGYIDHITDNSRCALAVGSEGKAITTIPTMHSIVTGERSTALTHGSEAHAIGMGPRTKACTISDRSHSVVMNPGSAAKTIGNESRAVALERHSKACSTGDKSISICLDIGGQACAGEGGIVSLAYMDANGKIRIATEYVGENILPNRIYSCNDKGEFVLID